MHQKAIKGRKRKRNALRFTFGATIFGLVLLVFYLLSTQGPEVNSIPQNLKFVPEGWMRFVPNQAVFVERFNVTELLRVNSVANTIKNGPLINSTYPRLIINATNIKELVFVGFNGTPGENIESTGVQIFVPDNNTFSTVSHELQRSNTTKTEFNGFQIFSLSEFSKTTGVATQELAIANGFFVYQYTTNTNGIDELDEVLSAVNSSQLLQQPDIVKTIGLLETLAPSNIGLSVRTFPGVIDTNVAGKVIGIAGGKIRETSGLMFTNSSAAISQYDHALQAYYGSSVDIYDNFLVITKYTSSAALASADFSP